MQIDYYRNQGHDRLLLFFCGWSVSPQLFHRIAPRDDEDVWLAYDYRDLIFPADLSRYSSITLVAWSLGVWVAMHVGAQWTPTQITTALAINGTPTPIHDEVGIPTAIFRATLNNLTADGVSRFNRRICGSSSILAQYQGIPPRPLDEITDELHKLYQGIDSTPVPTVPWTWDKAFVSQKDLIFPPKNQCQAWNNLGVPVYVLQAPHYPFYLWDRWNQL